MEDYTVTEDYKGPNRRMKSIPEEVKLYIHEEFKSHEERERKWIEALYDAFPGGDVDGHREYHQSKIDAAKAEKEFWQAAKSEGLKQGMAGFFAVVKWVCILGILSIAYKFGFGPLVAKILGVTAS